MKYWSTTKPYIFWEFTLYLAINASKLIRRIKTYLITATYVARNYIPSTEYLSKYYKINNIWSYLDHTNIMLYIWHMSSTPHTILHNKLYYTKLRYAILHYTTLHTLHYIILHHTMLYYTSLHYIILHYPIVCYGILWHAMLCHIISHYITL